MVQFAFPGSLSDPEVVDEAYAQEFAAVASSHRTLLFSWAGDEVRVRGAHGGGPTVCRTPMLSARRWARLFAALQLNGAPLVANPMEILRGAWLRHWHGDFRSLTPQAVWLLPEAEPELLEVAVARLGADRVIVRDADGDVATGPLAPGEVVAAVEARRMGFTDTIVLQAVEEGMDQARPVWWVAGEVVCDPFGLSTDEAAVVGEVVRRLGSPFVVTDVFRGPAGVRVATVRDGQTVPFGEDAAAYARLVAALDRLG